MGPIVLVAVKGFTGSMIERIVQTTVLVVPAVFTGRFKEAFRCLDQPRATRVKCFTYLVFVQYEQQLGPFEGVARLCSIRSINILFRERVDVLIAVRIRLPVRGEVFAYYTFCDPHLCRVS